MDNKKKRKYILLLSISCVGIALCIALIAFKLTSRARGEQASADTAPQSEAAELDIDGLKITEFSSYVYLSKDKDYVYIGSFLYDTAVTPLVPGKAQKVHYFDRSSPDAPFGGIPLLFDYDHSLNPKNGYTVPDEMVITYSEGQAFLWSNEETTAFESGASFNRPKTIYWSGFEDGMDTDSAEEATVTATFYYKGAAIGSQTLLLERGKSAKGTNGEDMYSYSVELLRQ